MKLTISFDQNKLIENGFTEKQCMDTVRRMFKDYGEGKVKETSYGTFEGDDFGSFSIVTVRLPYTNWFLKVVDKCLWYVDGEIDDIVESFYRVMKRNGKL